MQTSSGAVAAGSDAWL